MFLRFGGVKIKLYYFPFLPMEKKIQLFALFAIPHSLCTFIFSGICEWVHLYKVL